MTDSTVKVEKSTSPVISLRGVGFSYDGAPVLENIDLDVMPGQFLAVVGPNGGGKSTLFRVLLGSLRISTGELKLFGSAPSDSIRRIGYVPQNTSVGIDFPVSVHDVVLMGRLGAKDKNRDEEVVRKALEMTGMWDKREVMIGSLSGGQRQRAFLARAFATEPDILMLDEPTANVDPEWQGRIYELLKSMTGSVTVIVASHDITGVIGYADSIAYVNRRLHSHSDPVLTEKTIEKLSGISIEQLCPVEFIARILSERREAGAK